MRTVAFTNWLAARGAFVVLACRDEDRGRQAARQIAGTAGQRGVTVEALDLADITSVRRFAHRVTQGHGGIDILVNNAGIAGRPPAGRIDFTDLGSERRYRFSAAYSRSKLANLMFAVELDQRAKAAGVTLISTAVNPGIVATGLLNPKRSEWGRGARPAELAVAAIQRRYGQPPGDGSRTSLYAATAQGLRGGEYIVPGGRGHKRGTPVAVRPPARALDSETARQLWETSVNLTEVSFSALNEVRK